MNEQTELPEAKILQDLLRSRKVRKRSDLPPVEVE